MENIVMLEETKWVGGIFLLNSFVLHGWCMLYFSFCFYLGMDCLNCLFEQKDHACINGVMHVLFLTSFKALIKCGLHLQPLHPILLFLQIVHFSLLLENCAQWKCKLLNISSFIIKWRDGLCNCTQLLSIYIYILIEETCFFLKKK